MKRNITLIFAAAALGSGLLFTQSTTTAQTQDRAAEAALKAAMDKETLEGDLKGAIEQYKKAAQSKDRSIAARALIRMAESYQKLGDTEARKIYQRVVDEYADQKDSVVIAQGRLELTTGTLTARRVLEQGGALIARQVLSGPSVNGAYDISPDGRLLVQTDYEQTGDLLVRDLSSGETRRLMLKTQTLQESPGMAENPVFSSDAREIAFAWFDGRNYQLRIVENRIGAKVRVLIGSPEFSYFYPAGWSRDRGSILATLWKQDRTAQLAWVNLKDGSFRTLKSLEWRQPGRAALSPDGKYVTYSAASISGADQRPIYLAASDGSAETTLVGGAGLYEDPVWTADGKHVLFTSDRTGSLGLWGIAVRDGKPAGDPFLVKADMGTQTYLVGLTRNGAYYFMTRRGGTDVFVADIGKETLQISGSPRRLTEKSVGSNRSPAWSPDGKSIAFKRSGSWAFELVVHSVETGKERSYPVPARTRPNPKPQWFPDGKGILIDVTDSQGRVGYSRLDLDSGRFVEVIPPARGFTQAGVLSPDGRTVYIPKPANRVCRRSSRSTLLRAARRFSRRVRRRRVVYRSVRMDAPSP